MILVGPFQLSIFCGSMILGQPLLKKIPLAIAITECMDVLVLEMLHNP